MSDWRAIESTAETRTVLIAGVGGQGTILAGKVISHVLVACGYDVKMSEIHGMAQRGGSVTSQIRFGDTVFSPVSETANYLLAFEKMEAMRWCTRLVSGGIAVVNDLEIPPAPVLRGESEYPSDVFRSLEGSGIDLVPIQASQIAHELGDQRVANTVMLGVLATIPPFDQCDWRDALAANIKSEFLEINYRGFDEGLRIASTRSQDGIQSKR